MLALRSSLLSSLSVLMMVASVACTATTDGEGESGPSDDGEAASEGAQEDALSAPAASGPLRFDSACKAGTSITIAAMGDVLLHSPLQRQAYGSGGFESLWRSVQPMFSRTDLTYANLEGPCADGLTTSGAARDPGRVFDDRVYSSYPQFNYHPSLISSLKSAGVDVVSTANNHAMDRRSKGADRTIENLKSEGLPFTGTRSTADMEAPWYAITEAKGIRVAWLACTFSTNGIPDAKNQVLSCYDDKATVLQTIADLKKRSDIDAVIVTPHWGVEYQSAPQPQEKNLAHAMLDAGALAIFGGHPHVTQPWEKYETRDGREGFVIYSLGNFVSGQSGLAKTSSLILFMGLTKGADGKTTINGVRHYPLQMQNGPWTARYAGGASLDLTTRMYGSWNRLGADEALVTNPECH